MPRRVIVAEGNHGAIHGVLVIHEFPHGTSGDIRAEGPEAAAALGKVAAQNGIGFTVPVDLRVSVLNALPSAAGLFTLSSGARVQVVLVLSQFDGDLPGRPGTFRQLHAEDKPLTDAYPYGHGGPTLTARVEWSEKNSSEHAVFGTEREGVLVSYVHLNRCIDDIWVVGEIETLPESRRLGFAKSLLAQAAEAFLTQGSALLYEVSADNVASLATARRVGFAEAYRHVECNASVWDG